MTMWRKTACILGLVMLFIPLFGQNNNKEGSYFTTKPFLNKKNQHSLSIDVLALSYTYVHQFRPKLNLGVRFQAGLRAKFALDTWKASEGAGMDILELQVLYRLPISRKFFLDMGPKMTLIYYPDEYDGISYYHDEISASHIYAVPFVIGFNF